MKLIYKDRRPEGRSISGTANFSIKIFNEKTEGKQIYEEAIGQIEINDSNYSFNFGENGKSVSSSIEAIGYGDGEKQIFNYTVKNKPILGGVKINGNGYSWTELGSSDATKFAVAPIINKNGNICSSLLTNFSLADTHYNDATFAEIESNKKNQEMK